MQPQHGDLAWPPPNCRRRLGSQHRGGIELSSGPDGGIRLPLKPRRHRPETGLAALTVEGLPQGRWSMTTSCSWRVSLEPPFTEEGLGWSSGGARVSCCARTVAWPTAVSLQAWMGNDRGGYGRPF